MIAHVKIGIVPHKLRRKIHEKVILSLTEKSANDLNLIVHEFNLRGGIDCDVSLTFTLAEEGSQARELTVNRYASDCFTPVVAIGFKSAG